MTDLQMPHPRSRIEGRPSTRPSTARLRTGLTAIALTGILLPAVAIGLTGPSLGAAATSPMGPQLISITAAGAPSRPDSGNVDYWSVQASRDGTVVAFLSNDPGLDPTTTAARVPTVYVRDLTKGTTRLAAVDSTGAKFGYVNRMQLSGDGKHLAFMTLTEGRDTIYVRDFPTGTTERLANPGAIATFSIDDTGRHVALDGNYANRESLVVDRQTHTTVTIPGTNPRISGDGTRVVLVTKSRQLAAYDLATARSTLISVAPDGTTAGNQETSPFNAVSYDGRYVAFDSFATNLVAGGAPSPCAPSHCGRVYRRDMATGVTSLVDVRAGGADPAPGWNTYQGVDISADGQRVAFHATGDFGLARTAPTTSQLYVRNFATGGIELVSTGINGAPLPGGVTGVPHLVGQGTAAVFVAALPSAGAGPGSFQVFMTSDSGPAKSSPSSTHPTNSPSPGCRTAEAPSGPSMTGNGALVPGLKTADHGDTQTGGKVTFEFAVTCTNGLGTSTRQLRITNTTPGTDPHTTRLNPIDVTQQEITGSTAQITGRLAIGGIGNFPFAIDVTDGAANGRPDHIRIRVFAANAGADPDLAAPLYQVSGDVVQGGGAAILLTTPPAITRHPAPAEVTAGQPATLIATATGVPAPTVRWQQSTNAGQTWTFIANMQTTTLSLTPRRGQAAIRYRAVFANANGSTTSTAATLTVRG